jgi:hypothetical protein
MAHLLCLCAQWQCELAVKREAMVVATRARKKKGGGIRKEGDIS